MKQRARMIYYEEGEEQFEPYKKTRIQRVEGGQVYEISHKPKPTEIRRTDMHLSEDEVVAKRKQMFKTADEYLVQSAATRGITQKKLERILELFIECKWNLTATAEKMGVSYTTLVRIKNQFEELGIAMDNAKQQRVDMAERVVTDAMLEGDVGAAKFVLERQGRDRGWAPQADGQSGGTHINITVTGDQVQQTTQEIIEGEFEVIE